MYLIFEEWVYKAWVAIVIYKESLKGLKNIFKSALIIIIILKYTD